MYRLKTGVMISGGGGIGLRGVGDAGGHAAAGRRTLPTSWAWPFRSGTICWMWWATRLCSASPSAPIEEEGKVTFVDVLGLEGCRTAVEECTRRAEERHPPVAGSRLPVDAGSLAGGEKEVRDR